MKNEDIEIGGLYRITVDGDSYDSLRVRVVKMDVCDTLTIEFMNDSSSSGTKFGDHEEWEAKWLEPISPLEQLAEQAE